MNIKSLFRIPKVRMALVLFAVSAAAIIARFSPELILRYFTILAATLLIEFVFWKIRRIDPFLPSAGVVTATIVFLLSDPKTPIYLTLLAPLFAVATKQFLRFWDNHVFNPAAAGLFLSSLLGNQITWWGPNSSLIVIGIIILGASLVSLFTVRQWSIVIAFALVLLLTQGYTQFIAGGTIWFFMLVMLPEPMSAAKGSITKPIYGGLVALVYFVLTRFPVIDPLLGSLLTGNLIFKFADRL